MSMEDVKAIKTALDLSIENSASTFALYKMVSKVIEINHDEFMKLKSEHVKDLRQKLSAEINK